MFWFALILSAVAYAQIYGPAPGGIGPTTTAPTSTAAAPSPSISGQHIIQVFPNGQFAFSPSTVTANQGDIITFSFPPGTITHSVTQSSFNAPCTLLNEGSTNGTLGFDSGLMAATEFSITVTNASTPIWFHCKQFGPPSHCGSGMVGAINPPTSGSNTFSAFQQAASALGVNFPQDTAQGASTGPGAVETSLASSPTAGTSSGAEPRKVAGYILWTVVLATISLCY